MADDPETYLSDEEEEEEKKTPEDRKRLFRRELATMLYGFGDLKVGEISQLFKTLVSTVVRF